MILLFPFEVRFQLSICGSGPTHTVAGSGCCLCLCSSRGRSWAGGHCPTALPRLNWNWSDSCWGHFGIIPDPSSFAFSLGPKNKALSILYIWKCISVILVNSEHFPAFQCYVFFFWGFWKSSTTDYGRSSFEHERPFVAENTLLSSIVGSCGC